MDEKTDVSEVLGWGKVYASPISENIVDLLPHLRGSRGMLLVGNQNQQIVLNTGQDKNLIAHTFIKQESEARKLAEWTTADTNLSTELTAKQSTSWSSIDENHIEVINRGDEGSDEVSGESPVNIIVKPTRIEFKGSSGELITVEFAESEKGPTHSTYEKDIASTHTDLDHLLAQKLDQPQIQKWQLFKTSFSEATPESFELFKKYIAPSLKVAEERNDTQMLNVDAERLFSYALSDDEEEHFLILQ